MTLRDRILQMKKDNPEIGTRAIADSLGVGRKVVRNVLEKTKGDTDEESPCDSRTFAESGDSATCKFVTPVPIKTVEDALRVANVDLKVWTVDSFEVTNWTVTTKNGDGDSELVQNYRVHLKLKRIAPKSVLDALGKLAEEWKKQAPRIVTPIYEWDADEEKEMALVAAYDVHFGRLSWAPETGEDCDLKITDERFRTAIKKLVSQMSLRNVTQIVFPCSNDYFHIDNHRNTTAAGTPQDTDGRYAKVFETGLRAYLWAVEELLKIAPVFVPFVPGNHDTQSGYHLAVTANAYFGNTPSVKVDCTPIPRKYYTFGKTLIGFTHGNEEKPESLPCIMATERPKEWAASTCREWSLGHMHRSRQWVTKPVDTHTGVVVRVMGSLSGQDFWHAKKGYVGTRLFSSALFYGEESGYLGESIAYAK